MPQHQVACNKTNSIHTSTRRSVATCVEAGKQAARLPLRTLGMRVLDCGINGPVITFFCDGGLLLRRTERRQRHSITIVTTPTTIAAKMAGTITGVRVSRPRVLRVITDDVMLLPSVLGNSSALSVGDATSSGTPVTSTASCSTHRGVS